MGLDAFDYFAINASFVGFQKGANTMQNQLYIEHNTAAAVEY